MAENLKFPVSLCFAMTINKVLGQTLRTAGVDLTTSRFSHGQLYVALSRESGNLLNQLKTKMWELDLAEARAAIKLQITTEEFNSQRNNALLHESSHADVCRQLAEKEVELEQLTASYETSRMACEAAKAARAAACERFVDVYLLREWFSLVEQLKGAKREATEAEVYVIRADLHREHAERRLRTMQARFHEVAEKHCRHQDLLASYQAQVDILQAQMSWMKDDESRHAALLYRMRMLQKAVRARLGAANELSARLHRYDFIYHYFPPPGLGMRRILGPVWKLFDVPDPKYCAALEVLMGEKLYSVVVDTEETRSLLLECRNLYSRTTFISLDCVAPQVLDASIVATAQKIGGGADKMVRALDVITFKAEVRPLMESLLGDVLLCRETDSSSNVARRPRVFRRCKSTAGDLFIPQRPSSGRAHAKGVLTQMAELFSAMVAVKEAEAELAAAVPVLAQHSAELSASQKCFGDGRKLQNEYEERSYELQYLKSVMAFSIPAQLRGEIETLEKEISEQKEISERYKAVDIRALALIKDLSAKIKHIHDNRESESNKVMQELDAAKEVVRSQYGETWQRLSQEMLRLQLEASYLRADVKENARQRKEDATNTKQLQQQVFAAQYDFAIKKEALDKIAARERRLKEEMQRHTPMTDENILGN